MKMELETNHILALLGVLLAGFLIITLVSSANAPRLEQNSQNTGAISQNNSASNHAPAQTNTGYATAYNAVKDVASVSDSTKCIVNETTSSTKVNVTAVIDCLKWTMLYKGK